MMAGMTYPRLPLLLGVCALVAACPKDDNTTTEPTTSAGPTTGASSSSGPDIPTSTDTPTTIDPTTTAATTSSTTDASSSSTAAESTTGTPVVGCSAWTDQASCQAADDCKWSGVVEYSYGAQGCQGSIFQFCIDATPAGAASAWYREDNNGDQVVEFSYTPNDLGPEWMPCTCDGPLACLCTSVTEECPDRLEEFCGFNITELGCQNATFKDKPVCAWLGLAPEGPPDDKCEVKSKVNKCVPATDAGKACDMKNDYTPLPPLMNCTMDQPQIPTYWKDINGIIQIIQSCGPTPIGWTRCEAVDTPEQPDECTCACL